MYLFLFKNNQVLSLSSIAYIFLFVLIFHKINIAFHLTVWYHYNQIHLVVRCFTLGPYFNYLKYGREVVHMKGISCGVHYCTSYIISLCRRYYNYYQKITYLICDNLKNTYASFDDRCFSFNNLGLKKHLTDEAKCISFYLRTIKFFH